MCGRFALGDIDALSSRYKVKIDADIKPFLKPRYNIAPSQWVPLIVREGGENKLKRMKWGFVPFWAKDEKTGYKMINARTETIEQKPVYKKAFAEARCLVPSTGFFEWQENSDGKLPYFIKRKTDPFLSLAGLFSIWKDPQGTEIPTFTIITKNAEKPLEYIHDRMPVILDEKEESLWLDSRLKDPDFLKHLLESPPRFKFEAYPVTLKVNSPLNDSADLISPIDTK